MLRDCATMLRGTRVTKRDLIKTGVYPVFSGGMSKFGMINNYNREPETITIAQYGTAGYINYIEEKFWANDVCCSLLPNKDIVNNKYLYHYLKSKQNYLYNLRNEDAVPYSIDLKVVGAVKIPIPPLPIQNEVVRILDSFDSYINDISHGLPAEIRMREQQYEYYRDKLLEF